MEYKYRAIRTRQSESEKRIVLLSANSIEIDDWAGVPQKKRFGEGGESAGFQREESSSRVSNLRDFYANSENIIQNPLLCATRNVANSSIRFEPDADQSGGDEAGYLVITTQDYEELSLLQVLEQLKQYLKDRVPDLKDREPKGDLVAEIKRKARDSGQIAVEDDSDAEDSEVVESSEQEAESALFEESHILDFWEEVAAREQILKELEQSGPYTGDSLVGFDKNSLIAYLKPVVLVDGQHRLRGALEAIESKLQDSIITQEIENRVSSGEIADLVDLDLRKRVARKLPISLLMAEDPSEQVFQFVVVNQKATPINKALLGTIVSTSLSTEELAGVADRLKDAGIQLEESQAITYLVRNPDSPFFELVERGMSGKENKDLLQWSVFGGLVHIFRELRGGQLFGQSNDYAKIWSDKYIDSANIVSDYGAKGFDSAYDYWRSLDGPWRNIFMKYWECIRDKFADLEDPDKPNYWGKPRTSNLFNKISLTILAADFFQSLVETKQNIDSVDDIPGLVENWLEDVSENYFDKDWKLTHVKKDSPGIRKRWAEIWVEYRKNPVTLPDRRKYSSPKLD